MTIDSVDNKVEYKLCKPKNCYIDWKFNIISSHSVNWSSIGWHLLSKYPELEKLEKNIKDIENKYYGCAICGGVMRGGNIHSHHLIGGNIHSVHPTNHRILDNIEIGVCTTCHAGNGGFLHRVNSNEQEELFNKYSKIVEEKMKLVNKLIDEIDKLSLEYETKIVYSKLEEIKIAQKNFEKGVNNKVLNKSKIVNERFEK